MQIRNSCRKVTQYVYLPFILIIMVIFVFSRAAFLDIDVPYRILHSYAVFDECYYTIPAFNLFHYGVNLSPLSNITQETSSPTNISQNLTTYLTLQLFGNNFYGLRMGSVLCACLIFLFFYLLLKRILILNNFEINYTFKTKLMLIFPLVYLLIDFSFLIAGRIAEPTIYRMLNLVLMLYIGSFINFKSIKPWHSLLLGFLAFASLSFVYIYNTFIYAAFGTALFLGTLKNGMRNAFKHVFSLILGTVLCILLYQLYSQTAYNCSLIELYKILLPFQYRIGGQAGTGIDSYLINITFMLITNIFRFNLILLFIFLTAIPIFIDKLKHEKSDFDIILISLIGFLILQSIIINDYALRKLLILLPLVIIISLQGFIYAPHYFSNLTTEKMRLIKIYWSIIWVINIMLFFFYMNSELTDWKLRSDHFLILNLFVFLIGAAILSLHYLYKANINKAVATALLITILLPNAFLDFRYVFLDRTTIYRDAMISMGSKINGKVVVGGFAYAFRMYNTSIPVLNFYMTRYSPDVEAADKYHQYFDQLFADGIGSYSIGVAQDTTEEDVAYMNYMEKHGLQLEDEYQFKDLIDENIGLFAPRP